MTSTAEEMFDEAKARLRRIEAEHGIRILYACEAGSRRWGFPSPTSDYDIRFIYVRPLKSYLKLTPPADKITLAQDDLWDISGWDLKKSLTLLKKGNVSIVQCLYSPIVYRNHPLFLSEIRKLLDYGAPLPRLYWAYRSMAQSHVSHFLLGHETIAYKRFLYIVQGLLAMRWVETRKSMPPVVFEQLAEALVTDEGLRAEIEALLNIQRSAGTVEEVGPKTLFPGVLAFIESTLAETQPPASEAIDINEEVLDDFYLKWLGVQGLSCTGI